MWARRRGGAADRARGSGQADHAIVAASAASDSGDRTGCAVMLLLAHNTEQEGCAMLVTLPDARVSSRAVLLRGRTLAEGGVARRSAHPPPEGPAAGASAASGRRRRRAGRGRAAVTGAPISTYVLPRARASRIATAATSSPSSTRRRAPSIEVIRLSSSRRLRSSGLGGRPGGRTTSTSSSASSRWAERHARRTIRSESAARVASASRRSAIVCGPGSVSSAPCSSPARRTGPALADTAGRTSRLTSTSSASRRNAVSRRAARFSILKKFPSAAGTRSLDRPCPPAGARSAPPA